MCHHHAAVPSTLVTFFHHFDILMETLAMLFTLPREPRWGACEDQGWGVGVRVARSRRFLGEVGFLTTLGVGVGVGFFCPTPEVQLDHFLHHAPKLGIPVEMVQFLLKLLLKQRILAVYHDFYWLLVATKLLSAKLHSVYVMESRVGNFGKIGHFISTPQPWWR